MEEADYAMQNFRGYDFDSKIVLNDEVNLIFRKAGHILGAASLEFNIQQEYKIKKVVFTGDVSGKKDFHPFIQPVEYIDKADYLICESTYGDKKHKRIDAEDTLINIINDTCLKNKKTTLIASFSVQRLQEILWYLYKIYKEHSEFKNIPIYVDTPMGKNVSQEVFAKSISFYNDEAKELLDSGKNIFSWDKVTYVKEYTDSLALGTSEPKIIIASAGMAQAGRITNHIESFLPSKNCTIVFTGFCAIGTFGRKLLDIVSSDNFKLGETEIDNPLSKTLKIKANVVKIDGLSGHADSNDLVKYITHIKGLKKIILNHGEIEALDILQGKLQQKINVPIVIANKNTTINLK
jgi:metallo-beta-lactamase family protein